MPPRPDGPGLVSQVVGNGAFADLLRWRKEHAPGSGLSALLTSVLYLALVREGLCIDPSGYYGLVDIRRYLRERDRDGFGNLAKSLYVAVDPADPVAVGAAFADTIASGWALPGTLYGSLVSTIPHWGSAAHRARHTQPGTQAGGGDLPIRLSVSVMPNLPGVEDLPWLDTASRRYVGAGWTNGPAALNLFAIRLRSHLELCATFRTASVPADKVRAALSSVADPVALLSGHPVDGPVHSDG